METKSLSQLSPAYRQDYIFQRADGQFTRRPRHPRLGDFTVYDLDHMAEAELTAFIERWKGPHAGIRMYPIRPIGCQTAAHGLRRMAALRITFLRTGKQLYQTQFERLYLKLPAFAQWRRQYQPLACVALGKQFLKRPRRSNPARLLNQQENER